MIFFTADEHYGHANIIKYCNRPFDNVEEMDDVIIDRHNSVVTNSDLVIHAGDFTLAKKNVAKKYIQCLNGNHIFLQGSHDVFLPFNTPFILEREIEGQLVVVCHYAMRVWRKSHYNSWQIYGHSHSKLEPQGKQWDIGVDNNNFYPVSFKQLKEIMLNRPDNFNFIRKDNNMIYELTAYNTDQRYADVRYREYTSSKKRAELFSQIPKIQFTDSGHGIVFSARLYTGKRKPRITIILRYVIENLAKLKAVTVEREITELKPCPFCGGKSDITITDDAVSHETTYYPRCGTPNCIGNQGWVSFKTRDEAIKMWNKRTRRKI